jgi:hypothetical protein
VERVAVVLLMVHLEQQILAVAVVGILVPILVLVVQVVLVLSFFVTILQTQQYGLLQTLNNGWYLMV